MLSRTAPMLCNVWKRYIVVCMLAMAHIASAVKYRYWVHDSACHRTLAGRAHRHEKSSDQPQPRPGTSAPLQRISLHRCCRHMRPQIPSRTGQRWRNEHLGNRIAGAVASALSSPSTARNLTSQRGRERPSRPVVWAVHSLGTARGGGSIARTEESCRGNGMCGAGSRMLAIRSRGFTTPTVWGKGENRIGLWTGGVERIV